MATWFLLIQKFHPHVRHIPGKTNILADLLSRAGCPAKAVKNEVPKDKILIDSLCAIEATLTKNDTLTLYVNSPFQVAELVDAQDDNHRLAPIKTALINIRAKNNLPSGLSSFFLEDDVLHKTLVSMTTRKEHTLGVSVHPRQISPSSLSCYSCALSSCSYIERAILEAERLIYHPKLKTEMKKIIEKCANCCKIKSKLKESFLHLCPVPSLPFQEVSLDFIGPILTGATGCRRYILVVVDTLTRYIIAVPTHGFLP